MSKVNQMLTVFGIVVALIIAGFITDTIQFNDLILFGVLTGVVVIGYKLVESDIFQKQMESLSSKKSASGINYSYQEGKEIINEHVKEQSNDRMNSKKGVTIDQSRSSSQPTSIILDPKELDVIQVRHYYVTHAAFNKPKDFFVDVTNGQYFADMPVNVKRRTGKRVNPFEKLDAYQNTKRYSRRVSRMDDDGNSLNMDNIQSIPVGYPVGQGNQGGEGDES